VLRIAIQKGKGRRGGRTKGGKRKKGEHDALEDYSCLRRIRKKENPREKESTEGKTKRVYKKKEALMSFLEEAKGKQSRKDRGRCGRKKRKRIDAEE